jgi:hypothetical protein
MAYFDSD